MPRHDFWGERRGRTILPDRGQGLAVVTGAHVGDGRAVLAVFYDGACPVCRARIAVYQAASDRRSRLIAWCDVARTPWAMRRWGIEGEAARRRLHVVDAGGRVYAGASAFARLWRELPGYRWLGVLLAVPGVAPVAEWLDRVVPIRPLLKRDARHEHLPHRHAGSGA
jgi:predicted DCC family thiol-disulfide oxidoreductase YuxK